MIGERFVDAFVMLMLGLSLLTCNVLMWVLLLRAL